MDLEIFRDLGRALQGGHQGSISQAGADTVCLPCGHLLVAWPKEHKLPASNRFLSKSVHAVFVGPFKFEKSN